MKKRVVTVITTLSALALACSTVTQFFAGAENATNPPGAINPTSPPTESTPPPTATETAQPPLTGYMELVRAGEQTGRWSYEEGLIATLELMTGRRAATDVPGSARVLRGHGTGVLRATLYYLEHGTDESAQARLAELIKPFTLTRDAVAPYAKPAAEASTGVLANRRAQGTGKRCKNAWLDAFPKIQDQPFPCLVFGERTLSTGENGSATVRTYYPVDWVGDEELEPYFAASLDSAVEALQVYDSLDATDPVDDTTIYFTPLADPKETRTSMSTYGGFSQALGQSCPIYIHPYSLDFDMDRFRQTIAHEVFHCYQFWNMHSQVTDVKDEHNDWWVEGSAEFFSNVVLPCVDIEHDFLQQFQDNSRTEWLLSMSYESNVFFQYEANRRGGPASLIPLLKAMPTSGNQQDQAATLKNQGVGDEVFHQFGRSYLDGLIQDSCGGPIPSEGRFQVNETFQPQPPEDIGPEQLQAEPYTLARFATVFSEQGRFTSTLEEIDGSGLTASRQATRVGEWGELPDDIRTSCQEQTTYVTLVTTTNLGGPDYELEWSGQAQRAQCDGCLLGTWWADPTNYESMFNQLAGASGEVSPGGMPAGIDVSGDSYLQFDDQGVTRSKRVDLTVEITPSEGPPLAMIINAEGDGVYGADGERLRLFRYRNKTLEYEATLGEFMSVDRAPEYLTVNFFGGTFTTPNLFDDASSSEASSYQYTCNQDNLTLSHPQIGDFQLERIDEAIFADE